MAVGIPCVIALTKKITEILIPPFKSQFEALHKATNSDNIEQILNKLRTVKE